MVADLTRPFYGRGSLRDGPNFTFFLAVSFSSDLAVSWPSHLPTFGFEEGCHFSSVSLCKLFVAAGAMWALGILVN